ncbi:MAG: GDSL-type esterase/lipase family protein [Planctomycetota bacterium]
MRSRFGHRPIVFNYNQSSRVMAMSWISTFVAEGQTLLQPSSSRNPPNGIRFAFDRSRWSLPDLSPHLHNPLLNIMFLFSFRRSTFWTMSIALLVAGTLVSGSASAFQAPEASPPASPVIQPGDRVVLIGGGWIERMHNHPWLEAAITLQVPGVTFRNMGWSGDTVHGDARAVFGARPDGYQRLLRDLDYAAPKVALVSYGENEAFGGESERSEFVAGYEKLIKDLRRHDCRTVLIIPRRHENAGPQYPDPKAYNENLSKLADEIRKLARDQKCGLIDLENFEPNGKFTNEGIAWNDEGYRRSADEIVRQLGLRPAGLEQIASKQPEALEELRAAIKKKNEWFFHRYRPQNETYLFLFRKHEQGNNAVEVEEMEKFVRQGEENIVAWLKQHNLLPSQ